MSDLSDVRRDLITMFAVLFVLAGGMTALEAQESESPNQGNISASVGTTITSAYFFRGNLQEDNGIIVQPSAELGASLYEGENSSLSANLGVWYSLHSEHTGDIAPTPGRSAVYEEDVYAGLSYGYSNWTFGLSYVFYTSPNDAFSTLEEVHYSVSYDDSDALGDYALSPSILIAQGVDNHVAADEGTYLELGISPGATLVDSEKHPVDLTVPVSVGLGLDGWYFDSNGNEETLGYFKIGPHVSVPLTSGTDYGSVTLSGGLDYYQLTADSTENLNNGDSSEVVGSISLGLSY